MIQKRIRKIPQQKFSSVGTQQEVKIKNPEAYRIT
jgi:hypothetical protein